MRREDHSSILNSSNEVGLMLAKRSPTPYETVLTASKIIVKPGQHRNHMYQFPCDSAGACLAAINHYRPICRGHEPSDRIKSWPMTNFSCSRPRSTRRVFPDWRRHDGGARDPCCFSNIRCPRVAMNLYRARRNWLACRAVQPEQKGAYRAAGP